MTDKDSTCDVCNGESGGTYVGVAAVPGAPVSVAWCNKCLENNAVPGFVMATWLFSGYDETDQRVPKAPPEVEVFAPWVQELKVWHESRYKTFEEMLPIMWNIEMRRHENEQQV